MNPKIEKLIRQEAKSIHHVFDIAVRSAAQRIMEEVLRDVYDAGIVPKPKRKRRGGKGRSVSTR